IAGRRPKGRRLVMFSPGRPVARSPGRLRQWTRRFSPQTGHVAIPVIGSSARKLAQPFVEQNRRLWFVRRIRRVELARVARPPVARIARVDIISWIFPGRAPVWRASADVPLGTVEHRPERKSEPARRGSWAIDALTCGRCATCYARNHAAEHLFCQTARLPM